MRLNDGFSRDLPNVVELFDYGDRIDGQYVYSGHAIKGTSEDADTWIIFRYYYNESNQVYKKESVEGAWSLREEYFV